MSRRPQKSTAPPPADATPPPKQRLMILPARVDVAGLDIVIRYDDEGPGTLPNGRVSESRPVKPAEGEPDDAPKRGEIVLSPHALDFVALTALVYEVQHIARGGYEQRPLTTADREAAVCATTLLALAECGVLYPPAEQAAAAWVAARKADSPAEGDAKGAGE